MLRTARSRTFAGPDGTYVTRMYPVRVNFRDGRGHLQPIDNRFVPVTAVSRKQGYAYENAANRYRSFLPRSLESPVLIAARGSWVSLRLIGAGGTATAANDTSSYADALPGTDASYTAMNGGLKETLKLAGTESQRSFDYVVHVSRDLRLRKQRDGSIAFVRRGAKRAFVLPAPFVYDSAQRADRASYRAVSQRIERVRGGYVLHLSVKRSWLHAKARRFPVTVDPTVSFVENTGDTRLHQSGANLDCYVRDGDGANNNLCGGTQLLVGWDGLTQRRSMLRFDVQNSLPKGIHVLDAELGLYLLDADNTNTATVNLHRITRAGWTGGATWNKYDGTNAWTAAGGDFDPTVAASNTVSKTVGWFKWFPRGLVQSWIDGSVANNGVVVKEASERSINNRFYFNSSQAPFSQLPYLDVVYEPQTGQRPYYKFESDQLNDRMDLNVNVASGNLMLHASDVNVNGTGLDLGVDRFYNSQLEKDTVLGHEGWTFGSGADVRLRITSSEAVFYAPSGYVVSFPKSGSTFGTVKGVDATLCQVGVNGCVGESTYALTYNHAQIRNNFDASGKLVSQRDQNGNTISFTYDTGGHLTNIHDTQGRDFGVAPTTAGNVGQITEPGTGGRHWQYGYEATTNRLTSYTDPNSNVTTYKYDPSNGLVNEIDDPRGGITTIGYDTTFQRRVTSITRTNDNGPNKVTTFAYSSPSSPCQSSDFGKTVVTDPNGNATTYCYDDQGKVGMVFDAKGKHQKTTYDSNSFVQTYTSANNATLGFNTTVDRDTVSNSVKTVTQATGGSAGDLNTSFTYDGPPTQSFSPFYPHTSTDTEGHGRTYIYDNNGNLTSDTDNKSGTHVNIGYQSGHPGWLATVADGNGHTTSYGEDAVGNINLITPPGPLGTTSITYDSAARPCVVKDGKGQRTKYTYDGLDRVLTITKYPSTSTSSGCSITSGTAAGSVSLTYDANGSLTQRVDPQGTSTYAYNKLNRLNSQSYPGGRVNTYTYDNVGNLKTLADAGGTTTYGYDTDSLLASVAEPGGTCTATPKVACTQFSVDDNGNRTKTTYPNGIVLTSDFDAVDRLTCTMATNGAATPVPSDSKQPCRDQSPDPLRRFTYNYIDSSDEANVHDTSLRQSTGDGAGVSTAYSYDSLGRLKTATTRNGSGTVTDDYSYTYDGAGNMLTRSAKANSGAATSTTFAYNNANELCWAVTGSSANSCATAPSGATTYSYDLNGNQTGSSAGRAYTYNVSDQTASLTPPLGGAAQSATYLGPNQDEIVTRGGDQYVNNVLGIGIKTYSDATVSYFTRDTNGVLLVERAPGGAKYYYVQDGVGSTVATTGTNGAIVNSYKYDPYGGIVTESESSIRPTSFRFAGGLYSSSVGLHKFGMRWYDQSLDRWTQPDPIDETGDLKDGNRYVYVGSDPVNGADPTGLMDYRGDVVGGPTRGMFNADDAQPRGGGIGQKIMQAKLQAATIGGIAETAAKRVYYSAATYEVAARSGEIGEAAERVHQAIDVVKELFK